MTIADETNGVLSLARANPSAVTTRVITLLMESIKKNTLVSAYTPLAETMISLSLRSLSRTRRERWRGLLIEPDRPVVGSPGLQQKLQQKLWKP